MKKIISSLVGCWAHPIKKWKWVLCEIIVIAVVIIGIIILTADKPEVTKAPEAATVTQTVVNTVAKVDSTLKADPAEKK